MTQEEDEKKKRKLRPQLKNNEDRSFRGSQVFARNHLIVIEINTLRSSLPSFHMQCYKSIVISVMLLLLYCVNKYSNLHSDWLKRGHSIPHAVVLEIAPDALKI